HCAGTGATLIRLSCHSFVPGRLAARASLQVTYEQTVRRRRACWIQQATSVSANRPTRAVDCRTLHQEHRMRITSRPETPLLRKAALFVLVCLLTTTAPAAAQETGRITGQVTSRSGAPIPGVQVYIAATNQGTLTSE